jgi:hypothetical protein
MVTDHICGLSGVGFQCPACEAKRDQSEQPKPKRRYYCGMCEKWFSRGGDCRLCGFQLERSRAQA